MEKSRILQEGPNTTMAQPQEKLTLVADQPTPPTTFKVAQPMRHVDSLQPHPDNPRDDIDPESQDILDMADSICRHTIIEPLVITSTGMLIAGHRRRVAARVAAQKYNRPDLLMVPVVIRDIKPEDALDLMLQENMQRQSLTLLEEARAMYAIMERKKLTVADLAREIVVPAKEISPRLAILKCEPQVQALYAADELPLAAAGWLARIHNGEDQIKYAGLLARRQITLGKLKEISQATVAPAPTPKQIESETSRDIPAPARTAPRPRRGEQSQVNRRLGDQAPPTRAEAMAALQKAIGTKRVITLNNFHRVVESLCCACGLQGNAEVCQSCPFPRIILGVVGRAD